MAVQSTTIDHNFDDLGRAFRELAEGHRLNIATRSLNDVGRYGGAAAVREITKVGGFKQNYVRGKISTRKASAANLEFSIKGKDRYSLLNRFSPLPAKAVPGGKFKSARPWNIKRTYKKAFYINAGHGLVPVRRKDGKLKALYGPSVGRELERPQARDVIVSEIERRLPMRTQHYAKFYMDKIGVKHGL